MSKTNKERVKPDFRLNPDNIKVNDWVFSGGDIGFVQSVAIDTENMLKFMVVWNNEPPAVGVLAQNLKKLNRPVIVGDINYTIDLDLLVLSPELQQRVKLDSAVVEEYAEAFNNHVKFPPITIWYRTDVEYKGTPLLHPAYLIDGYHRVEAAKIAGITELPFIRKQGTFREALLYSVSINSTHGLRRSNLDKRKSVITLLNDSEWSKWSDREIGRRCGVSHDLVNRVRKSICQKMTDTNLNNSDESICQKMTDTKLNNSDGSTNTNLNNKRKVTRGGKTYVQDTTNIGKGKVEEPETNLSEDNPDRDLEFNDGGFVPSNKYPSDNRYYPEDVIKNLWDDDDEDKKDKVERKHGKSLQDNEEDFPENPTSPDTSKVKKTKKTKKPQKKEIMIKEGLNYFAGIPGSRCKWYIEASEEDYRLFQEYQKEKDAPSISTCLARMIKEKREAKVIHTDDVLVNLSSKISHLNEEQRLFLAKQLLSSDPEIFTKIREEKEGK